MFGNRKTPHNGALAEPREIAGDRGAREILSLWVRSDGNNTTIVLPDIWPDPAAWGLALADIARHIANAIAESGGGVSQEILLRVRKGFEVELDYPTDTPTGERRTEG
jgi:hypothetical protein